MASGSEDSSLDLPVSIPSLPSLNARIEAAIAALPKDAEGAVFLYGDVENGAVTGKVAVVQKFGDHWQLDLEGHVSKKGNQDWNGGKWDKGASVLLRGSW